MLKFRLRHCLIFLACLLTALPIFAEQKEAEPPPEEPQIVLYQTSWCGYCRKTRQLLTDLDAEFVMKDIENDRAAYDEYQKKGAGYRGVPLTDVGGVIVRGYKPSEIRRLVQDMHARQEAESSDETESDETGAES